MISEPESERDETSERQPPPTLRKSVIIRAFRALKRQKNRTRRRQEKEQTPHQINERMMARWTRRVGWFTGALVIVSVVTACIFWRQLNVMQGQLDAMERDEFPHVGVTEKIMAPEFHPNGDGTKGQVIWTWYYSNSGKGDASKLTITDSIRVGPNAPFARSFGINEPDFLAEMPAGKILFASTVSAPIEKAVFDRLYNVDQGLSVLIEFKYFNRIGKTIESATCLTKLATGAARFIDPEKCKKNK